MLARATQGPRRPFVGRFRTLGALAGLAIAVRALAAAEGPLAPAVAGRWDRIPLILRETEVTKIVEAEGLVWIGTTNGLAVYDGDRVSYPVFAPGQRTVLIVNDLLPLPGRRVLVGTINGSIWAADLAHLGRLVDLANRNEFRFVRLPDGTVVVANSFGRARVDELRALDTVLPRWKLLPAAIDQLAVHDQWVFLASQSGRVLLWDSTKPEAGPRLLADLDLPNRKIVRQIYASPDGTVYMSSDAGEFRLVPTPHGVDVEKLVDVPCRASFQDARGGLWLAASDGLYRFHGNVVRWTASDGLGSDATTFVTGDEAGNLWVGDALGLLRNYNYFEPVTLTSEAASIITDGHGGLVAGMSDGQAVQVDAKGNGAALDVGPARRPDGYYRGALVAAGSPGSIWILNHNGLFLLRNGSLSRQGPYPSVDVEKQPIVSFAVSAQDRVFAGQIWNPAVHQWTGNGWSVAHLARGGSGGSAVSKLLFDPAGRLWALTTDQILVFDGSRWYESAALEAAPDVKRNLFGALTYRGESRDVLASGAWGYPVRATFSAQAIQTEREAPAPGTPYVFNRIISHRAWGVLAATDSGLWRFHGNRWERFSIADRRLDGAIADVEAGDGTAFWIVSQGLWKITLPSSPPAIVLEQVPAQTIADTSATLAFRAVGLTGPPEFRRFLVHFDPAIPAYGSSMASQRSEYLLSGLRDGGTYHFAVQSEDAFGLSSPKTYGQFSVHLPWFRSPLKLSLVIAGGLLLLGVLVTRRGPTGFLLRAIGGRRWRLARSDADLQIEIERPREDLLSFRLHAPRKRTTVVPWVQSQIDPARLQTIRQATGSFASELPTTAVGYEQLGPNLAGIGSDLYALLPDAVKFAYEQSEVGAITLLLGASLLDLPWELWAPAGRGPASLVHAVGRLVTSDTLAAATDASTKTLRAAILAPAHVGQLPQLQQPEHEVRVVARAFRSWGARVEVLEPRSGREAVLAALRSVDFFHYAGHAHFDPQYPAASYLPLGSGEALPAAELEGELGSQNLPLSLIFVNGCGSGQERAWVSGESVFGLASPFLRRSAYFVGAQWPVQDAFSGEFSEVFYRALFPPGSSLWWRWLRRRELAGATVGEALRIARTALSGRPYALPTWPAYVYYGDPSARLLLE
jgi:ligand-binding sensor domain-containing protein/CHAT domain-containing protein